MPRTWSIGDGVVSLDMSAHWNRRSRQDDYSGLLNPKLGFPKQLMWQCFKPKEPWDFKESVCATVVRFVNVEAADLFGSVLEGAAQLDPL